VVAVSFAGRWQAHAPTPIPYVIFFERMCGHAKPSRDDSYILIRGLFSPYTPFWIDVYAYNEDS
jgi:hypothetical protein